MTHHKKVIPFEKPKPEPWRFFDFTYSNATNPIQNWYDGLSDYAQQLLNGMLKNNQKSDLPMHWTGFRKQLKDMNGIWELGFKSDGVQYRLLGMFDGAKRAVFLIGCYHKGGNYTPTDTLNTAKIRKALWEAGNCIKNNERQIETDQ